jgi:hypothetical protein
MKSLIALLLTAAFLAGCASPEVWQRPDTPQQVASADAAACRTRAEHEGYGGSIYGGIAGYDYVHRCMVSLGYRAALW